MYNKRYTIIILIVLLIGLAFISLSDHVVAQDSRIHILFLMPYTSDYPVTEMLIQGAKDYLSEYSLFDHQFSYEYLDLASYANDIDYQSLVATFLKDKYRSNQPDYIFSMDSMRPFLIEFVPDIFPDIPTLFTSSNYVHLEEVLPNQLIAVIEKDSVSVEKNIELIQQLSPKTTDVYFVISSSAYEEKTIEQVKTLETRFKQLAFHYLNDLSYDEMLDKVAKVKTNSFIYYIQWTVDVENNRFIPAQVVKAVCREASAPVLGAGSQYFGNGIIGGYMYDFTVLGSKVGELITLMEQSNFMPNSPVTVSSNHYLFDWRQLNRWHISEQILPPTSEILFREYSFWETYKYRILIIFLLLLLQSLSIIFLITNIRNRKRAEHSLKELNKSLESEVVDRTKKLEIAVRKLEEANETLNSKNVELEYIATTDPLTGLNNRLKIEDIFKTEMERYKRYEQIFSIILIDIDLFKRFNDEFGHQIGDIILKSCANFFKENIRKVDYIGRWGGEEFMIVSPNTDLERSRSLAELLRVKTEDHVFAEKYHLTISLGVASFGKEDNEKSIFKKADDSLYDAKASGRNKVGSSQ